MLAYSSFSATAVSGSHAPAQTRMLILTSLFTALTVMGAQFRLPLPFVPFSLQTFFVLISGALLGPRYGAASQLLYLALGLAGLPVFTKGGGLAYVFQPTFGYLLGFPLASFIAGALIHGRQTRTPVMPAVPFSKLVLILVLATAAILIPGVLYLWWCTNNVNGVPLSFLSVVGMGAAVFFPMDLLKVLATAYLYRTLQPRLSRAQVATPASLVNQASNPSPPFMQSKS